MSKRTGGVRPTKPTTRHPMHAGWHLSAFSTPGTHLHRGMLRGRCLAVAAACLVIACDSPRAGGPDEDPPGLAVLSDPAFQMSPTPGGAARPEVTAAKGVAYVSLPPGSVPGGVTASIRNLRTAMTVWTDVADGGFDPVAIPAEAGDSLSINVNRVSDGMLPLDAKVPAARRPVVVRTNPPPHKRDVPLNTIILAVFSEPIDSQSVTPGAMQVYTDAGRVAGRIRFVNSDQLSIAFAPDNPLLTTTDYTLVITQAIRDLDGETLDTTVTVPFSTVGEVSTEIAYGHGTISLLNVDSLTVRNLATGTFMDRWAWSPSGTQLAYSSYSPADSQTAIVVVDVGGSQQTLLTGRSPISAPSWSADGARMAFSSLGQIHVMNADGSGVSQITSDPPRPNMPPGGGIPSWSPQGTRIGFISMDLQIWTIEPDGAGLTRVIAPDRFANWFKWSPDGSKIAFSYAVAGPGFYIDVVNADGTAYIRLAEFTEGGHKEVSWSPDGNALVVAITPQRGPGYSSTPTDLYTLQADGSGEMSRLTNDPNSEGSPRWSPDGLRIAYTRGNPDGGIYIINADGSQPRRVSTTIATRLEWRPQPSR